MIRTKLQTRYPYTINGNTSGRTITINNLTLTLKIETITGNNFAHISRRQKLGEGKEKTHESLNWPNITKSIRFNQYYISDDAPV